MTVATARIEMGAALRDALPKPWNVFPPEAVVGDIRTQTLVLQRDKVERMPQAPTGNLLHTFSLWLLMPALSSEDRLDAALDELTDTLDALGVPWSEAQRGVWEDSLPAYRITVVAASNRKG